MELLERVLLEGHLGEIEKTQGYCGWYVILLIFFFFIRRDLRVLYIQGSLIHEIINIGYNTNGEC
mgnify:CR=1 FL=1